MTGSEVLIAKSAVILPMRHRALFIQLMLAIYEGVNHVTLTRDTASAYVFITCKKHRYLVYKTFILVDSEAFTN